jgi:hypothetical protein
MEKDAENRLGQHEFNQLIYDTSKVIAPLWFAIGSFKKLLSGTQIRPEAALCLIVHGANIDSGNYTSIGQARRTLMLQGVFDIKTSTSLSLQGTYSLFGDKLARFARKLEHDDDDNDVKIVLTKKGQNLYQAAKTCILQPSVFEKAKKTKIKLA